MIFLCQYFKNIENSSWYSENLERHPETINDVLIKITIGF